MKTLGFVPLIGIFAAIASAEEAAQKPVSYYKDIRPKGDIGIDGVDSGDELGKKREQWGRLQNVGTTMSDSLVKLAVFAIFFTTLC